MAATQQPAYKLTLDCEEPGDVVYIRKGQLEKRKTYKAKRLTVESAEAIEEAPKKRGRKPKSV
jgi:hypothetical protein